MRPTRAIASIIVGSFGLTNAAGAEGLALSAENRLRLTNEERGEESAQTLLNRLRLSADLEIGPMLSGRVTLASHLATGAAGRAAILDGGPDIAEAHVTVRPVEGLSLNVGRQEWNYGIGRIVSLRDLPNARRAFDGARLRYERGETRVDLLAASPVENRPVSFDDRATPGERLSGIYANRGHLDAYWLYRRAPDVRYAAVAGAERRHSIGLRWARRDGASRWDWEALVQWGEIEGRRIRAWTLATEQSHGAAHWPAGLRLGFRADIASGDPDPSSGRLETFHPLYPRLSYFSEAAIIAPANLVDVQPFVELQPARALTLRGAVDALWRHRRADAIYFAPFRPVVTAGPGRYTGMSAELLVEWRANTWLTVRGSATHFAPGDALPTAGFGAQTLAAAHVVVSAGHIAR